MLADSCGMLTVIVCVLKTKFHMRAEDIWTVRTFLYIRHWFAFRSENSWCLAVPATTVLLIIRFSCFKQSLKKKKLSGGYVFLCVRNSFAFHSENSWHLAEQETTVSLVRHFSYSLLFKNRNFFSVLFRSSNVVWHCTSTRQRQTPCSTPHHTVRRQQQCPNSLLALHVPRLNPNKHTWNVFERRVQSPCKCAWVVSGTQAGVGGHPSVSDSQPDPVHA